MQTLFYWLIALASGYAVAGAADSLFRTFSAELADKETIAVEVQRTPPMRRFDLKVFGWPGHSFVFLPLLVSEVAGSAVREFDQLVVRRYRFSIPHKHANLAMAHHADFVAQQNGPRNRAGGL